MEVSGDATFEETCHRWGASNLLIIELKIERKELARKKNFLSMMDNYIQQICVSISLSLSLSITISLSISISLSLSVTITISISEVYLLHVDSYRSPGACVSLYCSIKIPMPFISWELKNFSTLHSSHRSYLLSLPGMLLTLPAAGVLLSCKSCYLQQLKRVANSFKT